MKPHLAPATAPYPHLLRAYGISLSPADFGIVWRDWVLTSHAISRLQERKFTIAQVGAALQAPQLRYASPPEYEGCHIYTHERIAVAVNEQTREVVTLLYNHCYADGTPVTLTGSAPARKINQSTNTQKVQTT